MPADEGVVVVGASLAGATAAVRLRRLGYDGPLTLLGAEPHLPYERPALSKGYLTGDVGLDRLLVHEPGAYDELGIALRLGAPATGVDIARRRVLLDREDVPYGVLVIATGSSSIRPPIPGMDLPGVHQLRTTDDADALRADALQSATAVVVGTGFIGCEIAATLRGLGLGVTAVDALPGPLWTVLGPRLSGVVRGWHEEHGVRVIGGAGVSALEGADRVAQVRLADGRVLPADLVVVGVGARPALSWLGDAGIARAAGGLAVDEDGRTSADGVYAIGDVAALHGTRTEHHRFAITSAERAAHSVLGRAVPAVEAPEFWSDQYGRTLQYAGRHEPGDDLVLRPDGGAGFFLRGGVLTALVTVDNGRDLRRGIKLLGRAVDPTLLADPGTDLRTVA